MTPADVNANIADLAPLFPNYTLVGSTTTSNHAVADGARVAAGRMLANKCDGAANVLLMGVPPARANRYYPRTLTSDGRPVTVRTGCGMCTDEAKACDLCSHVFTEHHDVIVFMHSIYHWLEHPLKLVELIGGAFAYSVHHAPRGIRNMYHQVDIAGQDGVVVVDNNVVCTGHTDAAGDRERYINASTWPLTLGALRLDDKRIVKFSEMGVIARDTHVTHVTCTYGRAPTLDFQPIKHGLFSPRYATVELPNRGRVVEFAVREGGDWRLLETPPNFAATVAAFSGPSYTAVTAGHINRIITKAMADKRMTADRETISDCANAYCLHLCASQTATLDTSAYLTARARAPNFTTVREVITGWIARDLWRAIVIGVFLLGLATGSLRPTPGAYCPAPVSMYEWFTGVSMSRRLTIAFAAPLCGGAATASLWNAIQAPPPDPFALGAAAGLEELARGYAPLAYPAIDVAINGPTVLPVQAALGLAHYFGAPSSLRGALHGAYNALLVGSDPIAAAAAGALTGGFFNVTRDDVVARVTEGFDRVSIALSSAYPTSMDETMRAALASARATVTGAISQIYVAPRGVDVGVAPVVGTHIPAAGSERILETHPLPDAELRHTTPAAVKMMDRNATYRAPKYDPRPGKGLLVTPGAIPGVAPVSFASRMSTLALGVIGRSAPTPAQFVQYYESANDAINEAVEAVSAAADDIARRLRTVPMDTFAWINRLGPDGVFKYPAVKRDALTAAAVAPSRDPKPDKISVKLEPSFKPDGEPRIIFARPEERQVNDGPYAHEYVRQLAVSTRGTLQSVAGVSKDVASIVVSAIFAGARDRPGHRWVSLDISRCDRATGPHVSTPYLAALGRATGRRIADQDSMPSGSFGTGGAIVCIGGTPSGSVNTVALGATHMRALFEGFARTHGVSFVGIHGTDDALLHAREVDVARFVEFAALTGVVIEWSAHDLIEQAEFNSGAFWAQVRPVETHYDLVMRPRNADAYAVRFAGLVTHAYGPLPGRIVARMPFSGSDIARRDVPGRTLAVLSGMVHLCSSTPLLRAAAASASLCVAPRYESYLAAHAITDWPGAGSSALSARYGDVSGVAEQFDAWYAAVCRGEPAPASPALIALASHDLRGGDRSMAYAAVE